ncbi:thymopoietin a isoform X2 [Syngnathus typhle]|uniref:thymopoietin a isoform X2 n=1 Tax=Syngnathus typhle TaxID=161592 RepID=UPI002A6AA56D|nr:thymopoietin a isoform X2 [Syngnathus typhle]
MPGYMDDPSQLTKDKLKSELMAHNVELPTGNHNKDVYVQLYLENLTPQNKKHVAAATLDAFSSDEDLPPPVVSRRSRSSGKKATKKTDKTRPNELDVTTLTDDYLRDELLKHGVDAGPIVASTRKLYEKKLHKLLDDGPAQATVTKIVVTDVQVNHNGNSESDLYSDKEDDVTTEREPEPVPEPVAELEPVPVVERPVRSRGKTPVTTRTRSSEHKTFHHKQVATETLLNTALLEAAEPRLGPMLENSLTLTPSFREVFGSPDDPQHKRQKKITSFLAKSSPVKTHGGVVKQVEKIAASEQTPKVDKKDVLEELFANDVWSPFADDVLSPNRIAATCRRPIREAAGRSVILSDLWNVENSPLYSPKTTKTINNTTSSSYTESRVINRVNSLPNSSKPLSGTSVLVSAAPSNGLTKVVRPGIALWKKVLLLAIVGAFVFFIYQAMETNTINPFSAPESEVAAGSKA